jgi:hypothetical protein
MVSSELTNANSFMKNQLIQQIESLPQTALLEAALFVEFLAYKQGPERTPGLWPAIAQWRKEGASENYTDELSDEMIAGWRTKDLARDFSWEG